jgi:uncharacterized protein (DUF1778 family)
MATARLEYNDTASARRVRPNLTLVSNHEEVVTEAVSSTDVNLAELPKRIKMSARDFKLFLVALEADEEPTDALKAAAERFKQKHG